MLASRVIAVFKFSDFLYSIQSKHTMVPMYGFNDVEVLIKTIQLIQLSSVPERETF